MYLKQNYLLICVPFSSLDVVGAYIGQIQPCCTHNPCTSHVHVSLRNKEGRNIFAVSDAELKTGRADAANEDTKFMSKEAEWFLAGVLDGIADGLSSCL